MKTGKVAATVVAAVATVALLPFGGASAASPDAAVAAAAADRGSPRAGTTRSLTTRAQQYWTAERMAAAVPTEAPRTLPPVVVPRVGTKGSHEGAAPPAGTTPEADADTMTGRIFFVNDLGQDRSCTGTTVNSAGKRLVFTAGHCVHGGGAGRTWFDVNRWVFVPDYEAGVPYKRWSASQFWTKDGWIDDANRAFDVAAVVMKDKGGQRIVEALGGHGIRWDQGYGVATDVFGYPSNPPYDGSELQRCSGATRDEGGFPALDCTMTGGASGGPWLQNYGTTSWAYLNGINSWLFWRGDATQVYKWQSPYFSYDTVGSLYDTVKNM
jgi:V8-like Glu-specific endopeptidase